MSDMTGAVPGWYADPWGAGRLRWWDGVQWTAHVSQPAVARPPRPQLPPGTPVGTVWVWLMVLLPLVNTALLPFLRPDVSPVVISLSGEPTPEAVIRDMLSLVGGPLYFVLILVSWVTAAAVIVFAWLDHRDLTRRGVERPFHWAWTFLGTLVYVIGRTVILRPIAARRGAAPLWTAIAVTVVSYAVAIAWSITLVTAIIQDISQIAASYPA